MYEILLFITKHMFKNILSTFCVKKELFCLSIIVKRDKTVFEKMNVCSFIFFNTLGWWSFLLNSRRDSFLIVLG